MRGAAGVVAAASRLAGAASCGADRRAARAPAGARKSYLFTITSDPIAAARARGRSSTPIRCCDRKTRPADRERRRAASSPATREGAQHVGRLRHGAEVGHVPRRSCNFVDGRAVGGRHPVPPRFARSRSRGPTGCRTCSTERHRNSLTMRHFYRSHTYAGRRARRGGRLLPRARPRAVTTDGAHARLRRPARRAEAERARRGRALHVRRGRHRSDGREPPRSQREEVLRRAAPRRGSGAHAAKRRTDGDGRARRAAAGRGARTSAATPTPLPSDSDASLSRDAAARALLLDAPHAHARGAARRLYRQTKVVGGLFRSLGQEADAVGSAYALERRDILSPLIRNLGSMLVKGATPVEILKQYMAKGDSPTRGRELNIHFGDTERGFIGQISPLGDMVPVMAGVTLTFKMRGEDRVGLVYVGDGATSTGAFHEGINFAAVQRCPLVVDRREQRLRVLHADVEADRSRSSSSTRRSATAFRASRPTATTCSRSYDVDEARRRSRAARRGRLARRADDVPPQGTRGARQPVVRARRARSSAGSARTIRSRATSRGCATSLRSRRRDRGGRRARAPRGRRGDRRRRAVRRCPRRSTRSIGVYADPPAEQPLWFREGKGERRRRARAAGGWGTFDAQAEESRLMAEITYLEAIREALFEEMERDAERLLPRRGHRRVRRRVQGHRRAARRSSARRA